MSEPNNHGHLHRRNVRPPRKIRQRSRGTHAIDAIEMALEVYYANLKKGHNQQITAFQLIRKIEELVTPDTNHEP
jgi:hypothetical protein